MENVSQNLDTVVARFEQIAAQSPDVLAVKSQGQSLTYGELNRAANRLARAIVERSSDQPEPVALLFDRENSFFISMFAAFKAHKFCFALDPAFPPARLEHLMRDAGTAIVLTNRPHAALVARLNVKREFLYCDDPLPFSDSNLNLNITPEDMACLVYTSGSTGLPKCVARSHRRVCGSAAMRTRRDRLGAGSRIAVLTSIGALWGVLNPLLSGASLFYYDVPRDGLANLGEWLMREEITNYSSPPTLFRHFAATLEARRDLAFPKMRLLGLGGEPVYRRDFELYKEYFPDTCIFQVTYSSSETGTVSTLALDKESVVAGDILPVGYPLKSVQVSIVDQANQSLGFGQIGEIVVRSQNLPQGFWRAGQLVPEVYGTDGESRTFHTGDLGRMQADGLLEFVGRKDDQIKIRGNRVDPAEIETALLELEGIRAACVTAVNPAAVDKELAAYLVANTQPSLSELRDVLARKLPDYMIPSHYVYLDALPLLPNGKVNRRALPAPPTHRRQVDESFVAPRDQSELDLVQIWENLLGVQPIGVTENFFDLGGHSLLAARLLAEIEKKYARKFPPRVLVEASTVEQLAALLREEGWQPPWSPLVPLRARGTRPPLFYIPPFNFVLGFYPLANYLPPDQPLYALLASPSGQEFPFTRLEDEAAFYIAQIKTVQPHGPYYLIGWSYGGVTAFEMAQELFRQGERVAFLGILDIAISLKDFGSRWDYWVCRLRHFRRLGLYGLASRAVVRARRWFARQSEDSLQGGHSQAWQQAQARPDYPQISERVGFRGYVPKKYPGRVTLFQVEDTEPHSCRDAQKSWGKIAAGGVETHRVSGVHNTMLLEPYVRDLAGKLQASLLGAQSQ